MERSGFEYGVESLLVDSLYAGYIDSSHEADPRYLPRFISNDPQTATNLLSVLTRQLKECIRFDFAVAFVANGGLQTLVETLQELRDKGVSGRILTSTYLNFNNPSSLRKLLEYPNIETRIFQGNMHSKGYFFAKNDVDALIIGSANLTQTALLQNREWNVMLQSLDKGDMLLRAHHEFDALWDDPQTVPLSESWIREYEKYRKDHVRRQSNAKPFKRIGAKADADGSTIASSSSGDEITPNKMQKSALASLEKLHASNTPRALLVSATGTGKTYLSAFDVLATKPKRVLFISHRKRILEASLESFIRVLGDAYSYSIYGTPSWNPDCTCAFAMMGMLAKHLDCFEPDRFDYIVIDEAHRAGAESYRKIIDYFRPAFLLGMTATPSRTDQQDVYAIFNHVIAYRITLQDALSNDMLCPFHYFGIHDLEIGDRKMDDVGAFAKLTSEERVKHVIDQIEAYTVDKEKIRGIVFCSRNDEARELSMRFNEHGYRTLALSGSDSDKERNGAIEMLEAGDLDYIFTVDIFNEGIDIPSLNQIIMLRRTESPVVFIQQLGRGLRQYEKKEYTLVLDFIGNYQKNYFIPIALSGDRTYNKDTLRAFVKESNVLMPGCCTVTFDQVAESRIFASIDEGRFTEVKLIREEYEQLKRELGRIPRLADFDENEAIDPLLIFKKFGSYHAFLAKYEKDYRIHFSEGKCDILKFVSRKLANGKRATELLLLQELVEQSQDGGRIDSRRLLSGESADLRAIALRVLDGSFFSGVAPKTMSMIVFENGELELSASFERALEDEAFREQLLEAIQFGLARHSKQYSDTYRETDFVLYRKYTYEEVCRLLNWEKQINANSIGGYWYDKRSNTTPIFINYDKDPDISESIKYHDRFVSNGEIVALSKQPRTMESPEIQRLLGWPENGMKSYLFVRKNKDDKEGKEFYFLGEVYPVGEKGFKETTMPNTTKSVVEITYRLETPVRADIYDYLTSDI